MSIFFLKFFFNMWNNKCAPSVYMTFYLHVKDSISKMLIVSTECQVTSDFMGM